jgi:hypothetical protein
VAVSGPDFLGAVDVTAGGKLIQRSPFAGRVSGSSLSPAGVGRLERAIATRATTRRAMDPTWNAERWPELRKIAAPQGEVFVFVDESRPFRKTLCRVLGCLVKTTSSTQRDAPSLFESVSTVIVTADATVPATPARSHDTFA